MARWRGAQVDDLQSIDELETYVEQTAVIMIFVSKGYFKSRPAAGFFQKPPDLCTGGRPMSPPGVLHGSSRSSRRSRSAAGS